MCFEECAIARAQHGEQKGGEEATTPKLFLGSWVGRRVAHGINYYYFLPHTLVGDPANWYHG
jgi:hypothetical protein